MSFLAVSILFLTIPGVLAGYLLRHKTRNVILVPIWSWVYLVALLVVAKVLGLSVVGYAVIIYGGLLVLAWLVRREWCRGGASDRRLLIPKRDVWLGALTVLVAYSVYYWSVGTYLEIPADVYSHLDKFQEEHHVMAASGTLGSRDLGEWLDKSPRLWYVIYAFFAVHSGNVVQDIFPYIGYLNTLLLLLGVYVFALYVFHELRIGRRWRVFAAVSTTVLFVAHFGVNVFSYVRYYALAPTVTAYLLYLGAVVLAWELYRGRLDLKAGFGCLAVLLSAAGVVHLQEAVFIVLIVWTMALVAWFRASLLQPPVEAAGERRLRQGFMQSRVRFVALAGAVAGVLAWFTAYLYVERSPAQGPWTVPVEAYLPFVKHMYILNPSFQVYHVFAVWGYLVYLFFILFIREFRNNIFLVAGMVAPFLTVFNPIFVDFYLRFESQFTLYRLLYVIPFSMVGGAVLAFLSRGLVSGRGAGRKAGSALGLALLLGTLLPFDAFYVVNGYSRAPTLRETPANNSPEYLNDLLDRLASMGRTSILTDPVTGYVINGLTKHSVDTRKYRKGLFVDLQDDDYTGQAYLFEPYNGDILIVNLRDRANSRVGELSGHWRANILQTSLLYSPDFLQFVQDNPDVFVPLWENDRIRLYRIKAEQGSS